MAATIEGKPAQEWLRAAKERQAKGQYDETGAREAVQRMQGRVMPEYDNKGQIVRGGIGKTYNAKPVPAAPKPKAQPEPAKAAASSASTAGWNREGWPKTTPPGQSGYKAPEAARKVAEMPKPQTYASAPKAKPAQAPAKSAAPAMTQSQREGQERIAKAKAMIGEHVKNTPQKPEETIEQWYKQTDERIAKEFKADTEKADIRRAERERAIRKDQRAATPGPVAVAKGLGRMASDIGGGIASAAKAAKKAVGRQYAGLGSYVASEAEKGKRFYSGVGKWLTGDPEAKKRLAESAK